MSLLQGFHRHHIIPRYKGGDDSPENLVLLHPIDHAIVHLVRYRMFGNVRDLWAYNWLQGIKDPDVYSRFSTEREAKIKQRRAQDAEFDKRIQEVRSKATANRQEGYQTEAAKAFKKRLQEDVVYAKPIIENRRMANKLSLVVRRAAVAQKASQVRNLRAQGKSYVEIQRATGYSMGSISNILNNKMLVGVGESGNANLP